MSKYWQVVRLNIDGKTKSLMFIDIP
jgi:hypothetical protein